MPRTGRWQNHRCQTLPPLLFNQGAVRLHETPARGERTMVRDKLGMWHGIPVEENDVFAARVGNGWFNIRERRKPSFFCQSARAEGLRRHPFGKDRPRFIPEPSSATKTSSASVFGG